MVLFLLIVTLCLQSWGFFLFSKNKADPEPLNEPLNESLNEPLNGGYNQACVCSEQPL